MIPWHALGEELDRWQDNGRTATLWWRDDDAGALTPALERLLAIGEEHAIPVHLAVIPARLEATMASYLMACRYPLVLQHGFSHTDYAPKGEGSWELGNHRPLQTVMDDLNKGRQCLADAFPGRFLPVLVPPWTRISNEVLAQLPEAGFRALSAEGTRPETLPGKSSLQIFNTHLDPVRWRSGACFKGVEKSLRAIIEHLAARRTGAVDASEPTGLCTHHLDHGEDLWAFLAELADFTTAHRATRWISLQDRLK